MHRNPNPHMYCRDCGHWFWYGESFSYPAINYGWLPSPQRLCQKCSERENMPNIKITAEVDGKQVPLNTISTETFEAIKALEKPFICPKGWVIEFEEWDGDCGWRIMKDKVEYLRKDSTVEIGTGWDNHKYGEAPGYWPTKEDAENALKQYLEKPKKIPVARLADWCGSPRLIFKPSQNIQFEIGKIYVLHLRDGSITTHWFLANDESTVKAEGYQDIKPL